MHWNGKYKGKSSYPFLSLIKGTLIKKKWPDFSFITLILHKKSAKPKYVLMPCVYTGYLKSPYQICGNNILMLQGYLQMILKLWTCGRCAFWHHSYSCYEIRKQFQRFTSLDLMIEQFVNWYVNLNKWICQWWSKIWLCMHFLETMELIKEAFGCNPKSSVCQASQKKMWSMWSSICIYSTKLAHIVVCVA